MNIPLPVSCKCLNPKRIINPYTNELITVPCGQCRACIIQKNDRLSFQCDLEAYVHKKILFVTLTYAQSTIPTFVLQSKHDVSFSWNMVETRTGEILGEVSMTEENKEAIEGKTYCFGKIPYLRKSDLQGFLKRLRYYVSKRTKDKVRYYGCGEYGPVHFRPHFHLILFLDSEEMLQICQEAVYKSWSFGRCSAETPKHSVSSYVTSYVTSSVDLPRIYQMDTTKPFSIHSQRLGQGFLQSQKERVYQLTANEFISKSLTINEKHREFRLWRSCYSYFYPKVRGFCTLSYDKLRYSYTIYRQATECFPFRGSVLELARDIAEFCKVKKKIVISTSLLSKYQKLYDYFTDKAEDYSYESDMYKNYVNRIYHELLVSRHFLKFVCDGRVNEFPSYEEVSCKIKKIKEFYKQLEYLRLVDYFDSQRLYMESDFAGDEDTDFTRLGEEVVFLFYDNAPFDVVRYKQSRVYHAYEQDVWKRSRDRVKHKILNDKNKFFLDI